MRLLPAFAVVALAGCAALLPGADVDAALEVLASLGVACERSDAGSAEVAGAPPGPAEGLVPAAVDVAGDHLGPADLELEALPPHHLDQDRELQFAAPRHLKGVG